MSINKEVKELNKKILKQLDAQQIHTDTILKKLDTHQSSTDTIISKLDIQNSYTDAMIKKIDFQQSETEKLVKQLEIHNEFSRRNISEKEEISKVLSELQNLSFESIPKGYNTEASLRKDQNSELDLFSKDCKKDKEIDDKSIKGSKPKDYRSKDKKSKKDSDKGKSKKPKGKTRNSSLPIRFPINNRRNKSKSSDEDWLKPP